MALGRWMLDAVGRFQIEKSWVQVDGHRMHYLTAGSGPELILLHGLLGTASTWELTIPRLAEESTIYAVDALGIGESERVPGIDARLEAQADRMVRFMDESGIPSADFLATSHGGAVALTLAAKYPGPGEKPYPPRPGQPVLSSRRPAHQLLRHRAGDLVRAPGCHSAAAHASARPWPHVRRPRAGAGRGPGKVHRFSARPGNRSPMSSAF